MRPDDLLIFLLVSPLLIVFVLVILLSIDFTSRPKITSYEVSCDGGVGATINFTPIKNSNFYLGRIYAANEKPVTYSNSQNYANTGSATSPINTIYNGSIAQSYLGLSVVAQLQNGELVPSRIITIPNPCLA